MGIFWGGSVDRAGRIGLAAAKQEKNATTGLVLRICVLAVAAVALVLSSSGSIIAAAVAAPGWMCVRGFSLMG
jgi:hypothetical protein